MVATAIRACVTKAIPGGTDLLGILHQHANRLHVAGVALVARLEVQAFRAKPDNLSMLEGRLVIRPKGIDIYDIVGTAVVHGVFVDRPARSLNAVMVAHEQGRPADRAALVAVHDGEIVHALLGRAFRVGVCIVLSGLVEELVGICQVVRELKVRMMRTLARQTGHHACQFAHPVLKPHLRIVTPFGRSQVRKLLADVADL